MEIKLILNSETILNKVFPITSRGYNALAVDQYLDTIINDYRTLEANILVSKRELEKLENKVNELEEKNQKLEIENAKLSSRLGNISSSDNVTSENMQYLKRIAALEKYMYEHNLDPKDVY